MNQNSNIEEDNLDINQLKNIEFHNAACNAWFTTALEREKSLLVLSVAGLGLLVSPFMIESISSLEGLLIYFLALLSFITCTIGVLITFSRNKTYLTRLLNNGEVKDNYLSFLDRLVLISFASGLIFSVILGVSSSLNQFIERKLYMSENKKVITEVVKPQSNNSSQVQIKENFGGAGDLIKPVPQKEQTQTPTNK